MRIPVTLYPNGQPLRITPLLDDRTQVRVLSLGLNNITPAAIPRYVRDIAKQFVTANFGEPRQGFPAYRAHDLCYQAERVLMGYVNKLRQKTDLPPIPTPQKFETGTTVTWMRGDTLKTGTFLATEGYRGTTAVVYSAGTPVHVPLTELRIAE